MIQFCLIAVLAFFAVFFYTVMKLHQNSSLGPHGWNAKRASLI